MDFEAYDHVLACDVMTGDLVSISGQVEEVVKNLDDGDGYVFVYVESDPDYPYQLEWDEYVTLYQYA